MTNKNQVVAILRCENELTLFESGRQLPVNNEGIETMLNELVKNSEVSSAAVLADAYGIIAELLLNESSVGYFATGVYCKAYGLEQAKIVRHGEFNEDQLREVIEQEEGRIVIVPLFLEEI